MKHTYSHCRKIDLNRLILYYCLVGMLDEERLEAVEICRLLPCSVSSNSFTHYVTEFNLILCLLLKLLSVSISFKHKTIDEPHTTYASVIRLDMSFLDLTIFNY
jgi:hypothetical protein